MANNNVQNIKFLRNGALYTTREAALKALTGSSSVASSIADGTAILARYGSGNNVKTIVGFKYTDGTNSSLTIFDTEGASGDVEKLREEINAKLGTGITSGNTATAQLAALSGNAQSTSAETSVAGAKLYADEKIAQAVSGLDADVTSTNGKNVQVEVTETDGKITAVAITTDNTVNSGDVDTAITTAIGNLDYTGVTTGNGVYVSNVTETDGVVSATTATLPTVAAISEAGKPITAVSESLGAISATAGTINAEFVNIADSGEKFTATTVEGAFAEVAAKIEAMDKAASAEDGKVVTTVSEADGVVSETKANVKDLQLGGYSKDTTATGDIASGDTINAALSKLENKAAAITITNNDGSINVTTGASGTDINVNIKSGEKVIKLDANGDGIYTDIKISSATPSSTTVKEEYALLDSDGNALGQTIKIYKDSSIVSITYITDPADAHYQNLEYVYIDASGNTQTEYVDMSELVLEAEFASGVTVDASGVVHGVVDAASETFLTVGAEGFKLSGVKDAINDAIKALDATVGSASVATGKHVAVQVVEEDGVLTGLTVTEDNIADAYDLAELSAKTVTEIGSSNNSIAASSTTAADGTVAVDVITDADKIKMSGFSADSASSLSGIAESDSIATAFEKTNTVITNNERVTAQALTGLDGRLDVIESGYVETVKVNNVALAEASNAVNVQISASTTAATATGNEAIVVTTDQSTGAITLGIATLDCGTY